MCTTHRRFISLVETSAEVKLFLRCIQGLVFAGQDVGGLAPSVMHHGTPTLNVVWTTARLGLVACSGRHLRRVLPLPSRQGHSIGHGRRT